MAMPQRDDPTKPSSFAEASAYAEATADEPEDRWLQRTGMIDASADDVQLHRLADAGYRASVQNILDLRSDHFSRIF